MVDNAYKQRLAELLDQLIEEGKRETGGKRFSYDRLALKINQKLSALGERPITAQALNNWHRGAYKRGLDDDSARKLGRYFDRPRETAAEDLKAYLEGRRALSGEALTDRSNTPPAGGANELVEAVKRASYDTLLQVMEAAIARLRVLREYEVNIPDLIRGALLAKGLDPNNPGDVLEFARCIPPDDDQTEQDLLRYVEDILTGRLHLDQDALPDLTWAIQTFTGRDYSPDELLAILSASTSNCHSMADRRD